MPPAGSGTRGSQLASPVHLLEREVRDIKRFTLPLPKRLHHKLFSKTICFKKLFPCPTKRYLAFIKPLHGNKTCASSGSVSSFPYCLKTIINKTEHPSILEVRTLRRHVCAAILFNQFWGFFTCFLLDTSNTQLPPGMSLLRVQLCSPTHHAPCNNHILLGMPRQHSCNTSWDLSLLAPSCPDPIMGSEQRHLAESSPVKVPEPALMANARTVYFTCLVWML